MATAAATVAAPAAVAAATASYENVGKLSNQYLYGLGALNNGKIRLSKRYRRDDKQNIYCFCFHLIIIMLDIRYSQSIYKLYKICLN